MNIRHKIDGISALDPGVASASRRKMQVAGQEHAFDDSKALILFVDIVTEAAAANGIVCLGLGHLVFPPEGKPHVEGDVHLRLSMPMAASLVETLSNALRKASEQQSKMGSTRKSN